MVQPRKRISRRDIRQPDQFVALTGRVLESVKQHRTAFLICVAVVFAGSLALWGRDLYRARQDRLAAQQYARALGLYHNRKYKEAIEALATLRAYRSSYYGRLGLLYEANIYIAVKDPAKAAESLQELLNKERKEPILRQLAFLTLAHTQETAGKYGDAAKSYGDAEKAAGPFKEEAILGRGRSFAQSGNLPEALAAYREYLTSFPAAEKISRISVLAQEIQGKIGEAGGEK